MKIGIIICTYKRSDGKTFEYLTNTLQSVLNQTHKDYKIYLIGDRYDDNEEFDKYVNLLSNVDSYCENLSFANERDVYGDNKLALWSYAGTFATNYAMDLCEKDSIEYVCFLNHDDFWYDNHLEEINTLISLDKTDFICTKSTFTSGLLPRLISNEKYVDFKPLPCGIIHSSVCMNIKTIPLRYVDVFMKTGKVGQPGDAELWYRAAEYITQNNLKSKLINKLTCRHDEEGYEKNVRKINNKHTKKTKVFFATNEMTFNSKFFNMLKVSINSCLKNTTLTPYLIYDGENELPNSNCEVIKWKFRYHDLLVQHKGDTPSNAAFLRTEIPDICAKYGFDDDVVLYCDYDVVFMKDVEKIVPNFIACSSEFNKEDFRTFNTGVMFMNIPNLQKVQSQFMKYIENNMDKMYVYDQSAYNTFFHGKIDILPVEYNWKPYWEWSDDIKILHFHGLKPVHTVEEFMAIPILKHLYNISTCFDKYKEIYNQYI